MPIIAVSAEKTSVPVAEQCAWALGNVAGEGEELRNVLISQGALLPLARMMLPNKGSTVRTAAWALSNLIKVQKGRFNQGYWNFPSYDVCLTFHFSTTMKQNPCNL